MATLLPTLSSDDEQEDEEEKDNDVSDSESEIDSDFEFGGILGEDNDVGISKSNIYDKGWNYQSAIDILKKNDNEIERTEVRNIVAAARDKLPYNNDKELKHRMDDDVLKQKGLIIQEDEEESSEDEEDELEKAKAELYFSKNNNDSMEEKIELFSQFNLSRPLLRGVSSMNFVSPTPIQAAVIPPALSGRDICASAVTGSGKTAAFLLPFMERILQRNKHAKQSTISCLILTPTRELAAQCIGMFQSFSRYVPDETLRACLIVGGSKNMASQASELRTKPDIIIATPGRLLDHVTNTQGVDLDYVNFVVLDEADRLLELGFMDEVLEIIKHCPDNSKRQTMLFSATMNTKIEDLIKLSLKLPLKIAISSKSEVAPRLTQEIIKVRPPQESSKEAIVLSLIVRTFQKRTICFFDTKVQAHRFFILCGLMNVSCRELHGNLTQTQRLEALEAFRIREVDVLIATDVAARGLDIDGVETVVNFDMPNKIETYVHRIGRTARAGKKGRSCTLLTEGKRVIMKKVKGMIQSRVVPPNVIQYFQEKINDLEEHILKVLSAEAVAKMDRLAEAEATRAENLIIHKNEIMSRPAKEWPVKKLDPYYEEKLKKMQERIQKRGEEGTGQHRMTRKKRRARAAKLAAEQFQQEEKKKEAQSKSNNADYHDLTQKAIAKAAKKGQEQKKLTNATTIEEQRRNKRAKATRLVGDASLFQEESVLFAKKQKVEKTKSTVIKSEYNFRGYDPDKKFGKGGKKGHHQFKSKAKFKRKKG